MSWDIMKLGDLVEVLDTLRKPITKRDRVTGEYPYYGATGIVDWVNDYIFEEELVLIGEDGAKWESGEKTAFIVKGKYWVNNHAHVVKPDKNKLLNSWLEYYLYFINLKPWVTGLTVPKLNQANLKTIPIPIPPLPVQKQIVEKLDAAFADIDKVISATEKNIENAEAIFSSKLKETFSQPEGHDPDLGSLLKITSSKRIYKSDYVQKGIPFYRTKEIKQLANGREIKNELFIDKDKFSQLREKYGVPLKGDVLVTAIGTIGEVYVVESSDKFYFKDGNVLWLKDFNDLDPYFLKYSLVSFVNDLNNMSHGAAYSALPIQKLKSFKIKLPPLHQQSQIVTKLDNLKRTTFKLNCTYLKKISELRALKSSILNQAFSGELTKDVA